MAKERFEPICSSHGIAWPPARITLLGFKQERILEVWVANPTGKFTRIARYPILAASGGPGPKVRAGDMQVPEGIYRIDSLNPASRFHLSLRVDYPNADDVARSTIPGSRMGGDIYVHGNAVSAGCIALGDGPIEDVFTLVALAKPAGRRIIIAPVDFRTDAPAPRTESELISALYARLQSELRQFGAARNRH
jgi:murein L,D-transpeptidase YafK